MKFLEGKRVVVLLMKSVQIRDGRTSLVQKESDDSKRLRSWLNIQNFLSNQNQGNPKRDRERPLSSPRKSTALSPRILVLKHKCIIEIIPVKYR